MYEKALPIIFAIGSLSLATASGCAAPADDDAPMSPPPSDSLVYAAASDTQSDVGIAKWGFTKETASGALVFHGYDDHNRMLVELRQTLDSTDAQTARVTITMTGKDAMGSEKIDYALKPAANGKGNVASMKVVENTFFGGGSAARILTHLGADARSNAAPSLTAGGGSLTQSHPLDDGLVSSCNATTVCTSELIDQKVAAATAADKCSLVEPGAELVASTGAGAAGGALGGPPGILVGALGGLLVGSALAGVHELGCIDARDDSTKADQALDDCKKKAEGSCGK